jgi:hypothetical protein
MRRSPRLLEGCNGERLILLRDRALPHCDLGLLGAQSCISELGPCVPPERQQLFPATKTVFETSEPGAVSANEKVEPSAIGEFVPLGGVTSVEVLEGMDITCASTTGREIHAWVYIID